MTPELKQDIQEKKSRWKGIMLRKLLAIEQFIEANPDVPFNYVSTGGLRCTCMARATFGEDHSDPFVDDAFLKVNAISRRKTMIIQIELYPSSETLTVEPTARVPDLSSPWQNHGKSASSDEVCGTGKMVPSAGESRE